MSLQKWMARKFAVGGTARVFAKQYSFLSQKYSSVESHKLILKEIVRFRFNSKNSQYLIDRIDNGEIIGLKDLIIETLGIEASFYENDLSIQLMFEEVIVEELIKKNVPKSAI